MESRPAIKRYALVQNDSSDGTRRFHLARVSSPGRVPDAGRLERMEEIAERERKNGEAPYESCP